MYSLRTSTNTHRRANGETEKLKLHSDSSVLFKLGNKYTSTNKLSTLIIICYHIFKVASFFVYYVHSDNTLY